MSLTRVSSSVGYVQGPYREEALVCQFTHMTNAQGCVWFGGDPFEFTSPVILAQLVVIFVLTSTTYLILKPFKQSRVSAQLIAGIILGHSFLGRNQVYIEKLFPPGGRLILETFADVGFMFHLFVLGIHVDPMLVRRVRKNAAVIGIISFILPCVLGGLALLIIPNIVVIDETAGRMLPYVLLVSSVSAFPAITALLTDLNILNSEVGRLATFSSFTCDFCNYFMAVVIGTIGLTVRFMQWTELWSIVWTAAFLVVIFCAFRPILLEVARRIPDGQPMKEYQFLLVSIMVLICGLCSELLGQPAGLGAFVLGVAIPDGPPLGSSMVQKLDTLCTGLLVPAKFAISGLTMDLFSIGKGPAGSAILLLIIVAYIGKFTGTLISAVYFRIPFLEAFTLALIMCCKGIVEGVTYVTLQEDGILDNEAYAILIATMLIVTGIFRPLIARLYDPSAKYLGKRRNAILTADPSSELRVLVCIHSEDNVRTMISILETLSPTRIRPLAVSVLNLMELKGRAAAVLEPKIHKGNLLDNRSQSEHVANAFSMFAQRCPGYVFVRYFTSISPYASMHDDICTVALEQGTNIVIIPFHKQWTIDGGIGVSSPSMRMVNQNVLQKSPCSVGVLVDRGQISGTQSILRSNYMLRIVLLFIGGPDDHEVLAFSIRLLENLYHHITLLWLRQWDDRKYGDEMEGKSIDAMLIDQFRAHTIGNQRVLYREEFVKDAIGTTRVIRSLEHCCDLFVVGQYHEPDSPLLLGLTEWSECPELGVIGDMLATSSVFQFSVLVVQQQPCTSEFENPQFLQPIPCSLNTSPSPLMPQHFDNNLGPPGSRQVVEGHIWSNFRGYEVSELQRES